MNDFLNEFLESKGLKAKFWSEEYITICVKPPVPKNLFIKKNGDTVTITESSASIWGWFGSHSSDDLEMQFRIEDGQWTPLYLKEGANKPRFTFTSDAGAISFKPIVTRRQRAFAERWATALTIKGFVNGLIEKLFT